MQEIEVGSNARSSSRLAPAKVGLLQAMNSSDTILTPIYRQSLSSVSTERTKGSPSASKDGGTRQNTFQRVSLTSQFLKSRCDLKTRTENRIATRSLLHFCGSLSPVLRRDRSCPGLKGDDLGPCEHPGPSAQRAVDSLVRALFRAEFRVYLVHVLHPHGLLI